jgi:hypothetical protein
MADGVTPPKKRTENAAVFNAGAEALKRPNGNLSVHRYPQDIATPQHPHYVMFYISKRNSDIGAGENRAGGNLKIDVSRQNNPATKSLSPGQLTALLTASAAFGGAAIADSAAQVLPGAVEGAAKTAAVIAAGGIGAKYAGDSIITSSRDRVLLKDVIALYVNDKPSTSYKANWQDADVGMIANAPEVVSGFTNAITSGAKALGNAVSGDISAAGSAMDAAMSSLSNAFNTIGKGAAAFALKNGPNLGGLGDVSALVSSTTGTVANPYTAQLFKSMGFRTFSFNYTFLPKNATEYDSAQKIIKLFKKYMHPSLGANAFIMGYPAEFSMAYYYRDQENDHLFRISSCALTDMKVEYGGNDFITFKDTNGAPAEISMQLQFTELELLTADRIEEGY